MNHHGEHASHRREARTNQQARHNQSQGKSEDSIFQFARSDGPRVGASRTGISSAALAPRRLRWGLLRRAAGRIQTRKDNAALQTLSGLRWMIELDWGSASLTAVPIDTIMNKERSEETISGPQKIVSVTGRARIRDFGLARRLIRPGLAASFAYAGEIVFLAAAMGAASDRTGQTSCRRRRSSSGMHSRMRWRDLRARLVAVAEAEEAPVPGKALRIAHVHFGALSNDVWKSPLWLIEPFLGACALRGRASCRRATFRCAEIPQTRPDSRRRYRSGASPAARSGCSSCRSRSVRYVHWR